MNPAEWLVRTARQAPHAPALVSGTVVECDYASFADRAARLAAALQHHLKVAPGDRVALFLQNQTAYLELLYGIWFAGAVVVPINHKLHPKEAAWIIDDARAKVAFVSDAAVGEIAALLSSTPTRIALIAVKSRDFVDLYRHAALAAPVARERDDLAWLFYTSGTTGRPKGVMLSNANLHAMTFSYFTDVEAVSRDDAVLYAAPMSHGAGLYNFMYVLRGARHVVPESGRFEPEEVLAISRVARNVSLFAAPTMVQRLVDHAAASECDVTGIGTIVYGGGPMYFADIVKAVERMGPRFVQIYGQGESPMTITALSRACIADRVHERWQERLASVGLARSCVQVRVADEDGRMLPPGESGEILVKGAPVMLGYWNDPQASAATVKEGWLHTGDIGTLDREGFLTLKDRSKDVIISGGTNIYPREVEEVLLLHPGVSAAAVIGRASPEWGEEVVAFIVSTPGMRVEAADLDAHCLKHIARFKRPKLYRLVSELPKNSYGKVLKGELQELLTTPMKR